MTPDPVAWAKERQEAMLARPEMWGSWEAVEMQMLLLSELQALYRKPAEPIFQQYVAFLKREGFAANMAPSIEAIEDREERRKAFSACWSKFLSGSDSG